MSPARRRRLGHGALAAGIIAALLAPSLAPATVEEQRARLPPPATCQDPAEGVWMSHKFEPHQYLWYVFTLRVRRDPNNPDVLTGDISSHAWEGGPREPEPPPCRPGLAHWIVSMPARGSWRDGHVEFWGTSWRVEREFCGPGSGPAGYNLDHFSGTIDPTLQEFQSVNNDGGEMVNDPTVFRRVRCFDPVSPPHPYVRPPVFHPRRRGLLSCRSPLGAR